MFMLKIHHINMNHMTLKYEAGHWPYLHAE